LQFSVTKTGSLEGECLLQFFDNGTGLIFLNETNSSVKQEQSANDTEIYPILKTGSENGGSLSNLATRQKIKRGESKSIV
jgi:hypothetical protein